GDVHRVRTQPAWALERPADAGRGGAEVHRSRSGLGASHHLVDAVHGPALGAGLRPPVRRGPGMTRIPGTLNLFDETRLRLPDAEALRELREDLERVSLQPGEVRLDSGLQQP